MSETVETLTTEIAVDPAVGCVVIPVAGLPAGTQITISIIVGPPAPPAPAVVPEPAPLPQQPRYLGRRQA